MQLGLNTLKRHNLSIRVKADGFSFLVTDNRSGDTIHSATVSVDNPQALAAELQKEITGKDIHKYNYAHVRVTVEGLSTTVPQQEFEAEHLAFYFSQVFPSIDEEAEELCHTHLPLLEVVEVFVIRKDVRQVIVEAFPGATFTCISAAILGRVATFYARKELQDTAFFAYIAPKRLVLNCIAAGKLLYTNSFPLIYPKDSLYLLLSVCKVLELDAREHACYIGGEAASVDFLATELERFIQHIETIPLTIEN